MGEGIASATVKYSETGEGPTTIGVHIAGQPEGLGWDEIPVLGSLFSVHLRANVSGSPACEARGALQEHNLTLSVGIPDGDVNVMSHTWRHVPLAVASLDVHGAQRPGAPASFAATSAASAPLRVLSFNVWNVNPPRWLHRDHRDRFRAYALRMHYLGDLARETGAPIVAFQEVRYDSTLGGFGDSPQTQNPWAQGARSGSSAPHTPSGSEAALIYGEVLSLVEGEGKDPAEEVHSTMPVVSRSTPYSLAVAWAVSSLWWNKTMQEIGQSDAYRARNAEKWASVTSAPGWALYGGDRHPLEGQPQPPPQQQHQQEVDPDALAPMGRSPYLKPPPQGPRSWSEAQATFLDHPHAQVEHLGAALPGYSYVHVPAQLYLDKGVWGTAEAPGKGQVQRDEEGPAIFSAWPILHSDYLLLSRNTSDEGDTHQRLCLHAVVDASPASPSAAPTLVDVYTVHLSLSEAARNRTIPEVLAFVKASARGQYVVLSGDMNGEPHEPALRALVAAGVIFVTPTPLPTPSPSPSPPPPELAAAAGAEGGGEAPPPAEAAAEASALPTPAPPAVVAAPAAVAAPEPAAAPLPLLGKGGRDLQGLSAPLKEVHVGWEGEIVGAGAGAGAGAGGLALEHSAARTPGSGSGVPLLCDTWRALYPEPPQRDPDAASRRYALTFPSDDPVKRIDMVYAGCGPRGAGGSSGQGFLWQGGDEALALAHHQQQQQQQQQQGGEQAVCRHMRDACGASVRRTWTIGQDSIPGTDQGEGKGFGMVGERSAWYPSDHRGVVVELDLA
jgi:hypothetical protein